MTRAAWVLTGRRARWIVAGVVPLLMPSARAGAQAAARTTVTNSNAWFSYTGDHPVTRGSKTGVLLELQARRSDLGADWQQFLARGGVTHTLAPAVRVAAGYAFVRTYPYGEAPARAEVPEHRLWQQVSLAHAIGPVALMHRYRIEQRRSGVTGVDPAQLDRVTDWRHTGRFRYHARVTLPLGSTSPPLGRVYVTAWNELFVSYGKRVQLNVFDQTRTGVALGRQLTPTVRAEVGYLRQYLLKSNGRDAERNHTLHVALLSSTPLPF